MSGRVVKMAENKKHRKVVTFSFNYTYYDSYVDTINNFIQAIMNAAAEYNEKGRPFTPSARYDLNNTSIVELDDPKCVGVPEDKESIN